MALFRLKSEAEKGQETSSVFIGELATVLELMESSFEAIANLLVEGGSMEKSILVEVLGLLSPMTLNFLDKYLRYKGMDDVLSGSGCTTDTAWRTLCERYAISIEDNLDGLVPWKAYFIAAYYSGCKGQMQPGGNAKQLLTCIALMIDNGKLLQDHDLICFE